MVVFGDYLIFYRHSKRMVIIERILHGARDIQSLF
jgi:plasmid stabilization system protein ParE